MKIINYTLKILIIILGILIITGVILKQIDLQQRIVFGAVFILFGVYRLIIYYSQDKRYKSLDENNEN